MAAVVVKRSRGKEVPIFRLGLQRRSLRITSIQLRNFQVHNANVHWVHSIPLRVVIYTKESVRPKCCLWTS
jgi:hypothetical protein